MARVVCVVQHAPDRVAFGWSDGPDAFPTYALTGQTADRFRERLLGAGGVRDRLRDLVVSCLDCSGPTGFDTPDARQAGLALAQAGFELRRLVFSPNDDPGKAARDVAQWLTKLHDQNAVESLELIADGGPPVPWSLLYETKPDPAAFLSGPAAGDHWLGFWGLRYNLAGGQRVDPRRRMPWWTAPRLVMVVDPQVREGLPEPIRARLDAFAAARGLKLIGTRAELDDAMADGRPDVLYWLGHASPEALVLGDGPGSEIRPNDLLDLLAGNGDAPPGGLVFLNACQTAEASPTAGSFARAVFEQRMGGLIATEQQTIDTFAAPLGLDFLEAFLDRGETVGAAMRALRAQVPLGLLYGTYCPPDIRVVRPGEVTASGHVKVALSDSSRGVPLSARTAAPRPPLPEHPYRSLRAYAVGDRALFAGRDDDVLRFAAVLDDPAARVVLLHGESGVGKTSFLRAGVIPYLETECVGYRFTRDRAADGADAVLVLRATNDPVTQLATALTAYCARPLTYRTPAGDEVAADLPAALSVALDGRTGPDALRDALRADPALLGRLLALLAAELPFTPVLVIDQAEEVFTLARTPTDEETRNVALELLRRAAGGPGGFKVVVALRTEYHGRFVDRLRRGARDGGGVREYLLTDFGTDALTEVIARPTSDRLIAYSSEVPHEKYGFRYADGLAAEIARRARAYTVNRQDSVLPLVQVICSQLYAAAKARPDATVTAADLHALGGYEGGMKRHAEELVRRLFPDRADRAAFQRLLTDRATRLYIRQSDGTLTTALLPADFLAKHWTGRTPFDRMLATASGGDWRLLRVNSLRIGEDEAERPYVSLGHDALAKVAAKWDEERTRKAQLRNYAVALAVLFVVAGGLTALTGWALEQKKTADGQRDEAKEQRGKAEHALKVAGEERERADGLAAQRVKDAEAARENKLKDRANGLVDALATADTSVVPQLLLDLADHRERAKERLTAMAGEPVGTPAGLHGRLALADDPRRAAELVAYLPACRPQELPVIRDALKPHAAAAERLWGVLANPVMPPGRRARAAAVLAGLAPATPRWADLAPEVVGAAVQASAAESVVWVEALEPVGAALLPELNRRYRLIQDHVHEGFFIRPEELQEESVRLDRTAELLARFAAGRAPDVVELLATVDVRHHALLAKLVADRPELRPAVAAGLRAELAKPGPPDGYATFKEVAGAGYPPLAALADPDRFQNASAKRKARAAAVLLVLGTPDDAAAVWPLLVHTPDPTARSWLLHRMVGIRVPPAVLAERFRVEPDVTARRALVLALGDYAPDAVPRPTRDPLAREFLRLYISDPDAGLHGALDWVLRQRWGMADEVAEADLKRAGRDDPARAARDWYVNEEGQTYTIIRSPKWFTMGSPAYEPGRGPNHVRPHEKKIGRAYAVAAREVTVDEFERFRPGYRAGLSFIPRWLAPAEQVSWYDAAAYCNWLSERAGIRPEEWCYLPNANGRYAAGMMIPRDHLKRTGYRLPTEAEWEYAARAGSRVGRFFGRADGLLPAYSWGRANSRERLEEVGFLKPNDMGLFDVLGGALEWVGSVAHPVEQYPIDDLEDRGPDGAEVVGDETLRGLRGGSFAWFPNYLRSSYRYNYRPNERLNTNGFRPVRTVRE